jgi:hypothetical protein
MYQCKCDKINYMCFTLSCKSCCNDASCVVHSNSEVVLPYRRKLKRAQSMYKKLPNTCSECATYRYDEGCITNCCKSCCKSRACPKHVNLDICFCGEMSDKRCMHRLCIGCCNDSQCREHKNKCVCGKACFDKDCIVRQCKECCKYPLCYSHCNLFDDRWYEYNDAMILFEDALEDCKLFPEELVHHIFTNYIEERPICNKCKTHLFDFDDVKHYCNQCEKLFCKYCVIYDDYDDDDNIKSYCCGVNIIPKLRLTFDTSRHI